MLINSWGNLIATMVEAEVHLLSVSSSIAISATLDPSKSWFLEG